jgi:hypothetical protein
LGTGEWRRVEEVEESGEERTESVEESGEERTEGVAQVFRV